MAAPMTQPAASAASGVPSAPEQQWPLAGSPGTAQNPAYPRVDAQFHPVYGPFSADQSLTAIDLPNLNFVLG